MEKLNENFLIVLNKIVNDILNDGQTGRRKGTASYYFVGSVGKTAFCYTRAKTYYKNRFGFWSWKQTAYKNGRTKRTSFALSGSGKKAHDRAKRLYNKHKNKG